MTRRATLFAVLLVLWGNIVSFAFGSTASLPGGSWSFVFAGLALVALSLVVARWLGLDAAALGVTGNAVKGGLAGLTIGVTAAALAVAALRTVGPAIVGHPIEYAPLATATGPDLARHVAFFLLLGSVVPEEIAFRGVLLGALGRAFDKRRANVASAIAFALWHGWVVFGTLGDTTLGPASAWFIAGIVGALLAVLAGGALFAWLRFHTETLASTILAHWCFNAVVLVGLWSTRPAPPGCC